LPEKVARRRPWLCIYQAWALAFAGQLEGVEPLLKDAEVLIQSPDSLKKKSVSGPKRQEMVANIAAMRAYIAVVTGDFSHAIESANLASATLSEKSPFVYSVFKWALGYSYRMRGDLTVAGQSFSEVVKVGRAMDNVWTTVMGMVDLAMVRKARGQLRQTAALCREALQLATDRGDQSLGYIGRVEATLANVLYEQNDLAAAQRYAIDSIEKTYEWENPNHFVFSYDVLARVLQAQGDFQGALDALQEADQVRGKFSVMPMLIGMLEKSKVRLWLAQDNTTAIESWAQENGVYDAGESFVLTEIPEEKKPLLITLARVFIAQHKMDEALGLLESLKESAEEGENINILIEILILQALALQNQNNITFALKALERSLVLAESGSFIRIFVDEGPPLAKLLEKILNENADVPRAYVKKLLSAFRLSKVIRTDDGLVERLSERELEVLRLIAGGLSNNKITEELFISLSTVKTHTRNIYSKLNVHSRTEAIVKAKDLELL